MVFEVKVWVDVGPEENRSIRELKRSATDAVKASDKLTIIRGVRQLKTVKALTLRSETVEVVDATFE